MSGLSLMSADQMKDPYAVAELAISNVASCREAKADLAYARLTQRWTNAKELALRNGHGPRLQELDRRIHTFRSEASFAQCWGGFSSARERAEQAVSAFESDASRRI